MSFGERKTHHTNHHLKGKRMKKKTEAYHVQVNKELLDEAKKLVNLPQAFRAMVENIVKNKVCSACGRPLEQEE